MEAKIISNKNVIIIGAGIGGISSAARLAKKGFNVTVIEKNKKLGGRCNYLKIDGHYFDTGPSFLLMSEIYSKKFEEL